MSSMQDTTSMQAIDLAIDIRCSPRRLASVIDNLNNAQKDVVKEMGFGSILYLPAINLHQVFLAWLLKRCDPIKRSILINNIDIYITEWDLHCIIGLSDKGEEILSQKHKSN